MVLALEEKYFLVVSGEFDREPITYDSHPTEEEILEVIKEKKGKSARIEKRYVLKSQQSEHTAH